MTVEDAGRVLGAACGQLAAQEHMAPRQEEEVPVPKFQQFSKAQGHTVAVVTFSKLVNI